MRPGFLFNTVLICDVLFLVIALVLLGREKSRPLARLFLLGCLYLTLALITRVYIGDTANQFRANDADYYRFEFSALTEVVQQHTELNFEKARGWRRGPMAYLWMWPLAKVYGNALPKRLIYGIQIAIVLLCISLSIMTFGRPERYIFEIPIYSILWIGSTGLRYELNIADINGLFGLALFPMLAFYLFSRRKLGVSGVAIALGAHFRVIAVAQALYLSLRSRKAFTSIVATTIVILTLGTLWISPLQGYLYWFRMAQDILFTGKDALTSTGPTWHENIAPSGVLARFVSGFHFAGTYVAVLSDTAARVCVRVGSLIQIAFIGLTMALVWQDKNMESHLTSKLDSPVFNTFLLVEASIGFSLAYFFATEFEQQLFPALIPSYCVGMYLLITRWRTISPVMKGFYFIGVLFTLNVFGYDWLCRVLPLAAINRHVGNETQFTCFEMISVFLIDWLGLVFFLIFAVHSWFELRKEIAETEGAAKVLS